MGLLHSAVARAEKLQGAVARLTSRLPASSQRTLAKVLGFDQQFDQVDPHLQLIIAARDRMSPASLIGKNPEKSRRAFHNEMKALIATPTPVAAVTNWDIPSRAGHRIAVRHYSPHLQAGTQKTKTALPLLVFYHGGGFVVGDLDTHDEPCRILCQQAQVHVLSVDYRLAPEHPAPAAVEDCVDALQWAFTHAFDLSVDPSKIAVGGDSAGGNLAAVVSQLAAGKSYAPAAQLLIYPVVDLLNKYPTHKTYGKGLLLSQSDMDNAKASYVGTSQLAFDDPQVSPLFGNLANLAPALLVTAQFDTLRDEGETYAMKLHEAGTPCIAHRAEGQGHGFINLTSVNRAAFKATRRLAHDFRALLDGLS